MDVFIFFAIKLIFTSSIYRNQNNYEISQNINNQSNPITINKEKHFFTSIEEICNQSFYELNYVKIISTEAQNIINKTKNIEIEKYSMQICQIIILSIEEKNFCKNQSYKNIKNFEPKNLKLRMNICNEIAISLVDNMTNLSFKSKPDNEYYKHNNFMYYRIPKIDKIYDFIFLISLALHNLAVEIIDSYLHQYDDSFSDQLRDNELLKMNLVANIIYKFDMGISIVLNDFFFENEIVGSRNADILYTLCSK